jgi:ABC-2 type transport system permease protein
VFRAYIRKEFLLVGRDRGALLSLFVLPLVFIAVFGTLMTGQDQQVKSRAIAVYADPAAALGQSVVLALKDSEVFAVELRTSAEEVRKSVAERRKVVGVVVPADFNPLAGRPAELVIDEAASPQLKGPIEGALYGTLARALLPGDDVRLFESRTPPQLRPAVERQGGFQVAIPGNAILFIFFLSLTVALSFVEERKSGTWTRILAAPVSRWMVVVAKLVPFFFVGLIQMLFIFAVGSIAFGMQIGGSVLALALVTAVVVFCAVSLGFFIASFSGTQKQVGAIGSIVLLTMGLLGGAMFPRLAMSPLMQKVGLVTPHAWSLDAYYDLLLRQGAGFVDVAAEVVALVLISLLLLFIGRLRFRF